MDVGKTVKVPKTRKELVHRLESVPVFVPVEALPTLLTVCVVVDPLVVSSDRTGREKIDGDGGVSSRCCCRGREPWDPNE